jgi:hypothetical protein
VGQLLGRLLVGKHYKAWGDPGERHWTSLLSCGLHVVLCEIATVGSRFSVCFLQERPYARLSIGAGRSSRFEGHLARESGDCLQTVAFFFWTREW